MSTLTELVEQIKQLSIGEQLLLLEKTIMIMRESLSAPSPQNGEKLVGAEQILAKYPVSASQILPSLPVKGDLNERLARLLNTPDPPRENMLPRGLLEGCDFTEEDFRAAEWHPTLRDLLDE